MSLWSQKKPIPTLLFLKMKAGNLPLAKNRVILSQVKYSCPKATNLPLFLSRATPLEEEESPLGWKHFKEVPTCSKT
jgi:hypothetical protein